VSRCLSAGEQLALQIRDLPVLTSRADVVCAREISRERNAINFPRRQFLHLAAVAAALPVVSQIARAQAYPTRPIALVVPIAAGGVVDTAARIVAEKLQEKLRQSVVVENRPGAGSIIGTNFVAKAAAR
jgi:hypothetical protein